MKLRIATFNLENFDEGRQPSLEERIAALRPLIQVDTMTAPLGLQ
jgi:hypothetical protein